MSVATASNSSTCPWRRLQGPRPHDATGCSADGADPFRRHRWVGVVLSGAYSADTDDLDALHRLNPKGNRKLNRAIHIIAVCQTRHPSPGRDYYLRKMDEGKTRKEALRALKRQISNEVYRHLVYDAERY